LVSQIHEGSPNRHDQAWYGRPTSRKKFSSIIALAVTSSGFAIFGTSISPPYPNSGFPTVSNDSINLSFVTQAEHFIILFFGGSAIGLGIAAATHRLHTLMNDPLSET
jgi:hypothetical protein